MIVGHKIEQHLTIVAMDYGRHHEVTTTRKVTELHATKGWRKVATRKHTQRVKLPPTIKQKRADTFTRFEPVRRSGPVDPRPDWIDGVSESVRDRAINRHKVRRIEIQRAKNLAALAAG